MSDRKQHGRRPSRPRRQTEQGQNPPKRRRRLPTRVKMSVDDTLAANPHHPLAQAAPEVRAAGRLRIIAGILVRLAQTDLARKP